MKINDINRDPAILGSTTETLQNRKVQPQQGDEFAGVEEQKKGEEVNISRTSVEFSRAAEMMERESPQREERIRAIQKEIQEGTYQMNATKIADKMLRDILTE